MLASSYPVLDAFLTMLYFFLFIIWIWLLIMVFTDIFRSHDMGGEAKAIWVIFVIILPYLGVFVYLLARGGKMHERAAQLTTQDQEATTIHPAGGRAPVATERTQIAKLADLKAKGVIAEAEYQAEKAKVVGS